jgi:hypothetical protein
VVNKVELLAAWLEKCVITEVKSSSAWLERGTIKKLISTWLERVVVKVVWTNIVAKSDNCEMGGGEEGEEDS